MNNDKIDKLDLLDQIQHVEAPPFLLTRIRQKIETKASKFFSPKLTWTLLAILFVVLMLNASILIERMNEAGNDKNLVEVLHLLPNNSLY